MGRKKNAPGVVLQLPKSFKWEPYYLDMANYISTNYNEYTTALASSKKIVFLRKMRDFLKISCTDIQLKNGMHTFLKKYNEIKQKLNSSGFGIDPEKDTTLNKGWILKQCPYFEILDAVMGTRPNVTPPCIVTTSIVAGQSLAPTPTASKVSDDLTDDTVMETEDASNGNSEEEDGTAEETTVSVEDGDLEKSFSEGGSKEKMNELNDSATTLYVKKALSGIDLKRKEKLATKTPMGMFAKVMEDKTAQVVQMERDKLLQLQQQFEKEEEIKKERNQIELLKVNSQIEIEKKKLDLESERIKERRADREHELKILQMTQEFELKKLQFMSQHK